MIPKKIFQTHKDYNLPDDLKNFIKNLISLNPEFEYTFMDNDECYSFIKDNFDEEFLRMYKNLPLDIIRADVWRVAVIYVNGGIYCDCDVQCVQNLAPLISDEELVLFLEESGGTSNFFFAATPKHPALKEALDSMVRHHNWTRDSYADLMVQNFGMYIFHDAVSKAQNKKILPYQENIKWLVHIMQQTWREMEYKYKQASNTTKPITFVTTFHQAGYDLYGKTWIESFIKNVASKRNNVYAIVYAHSIRNIKVDHPQVKVVDYDQAFPKHQQWKQDYLKLSNHSTYVKDMTVRFSHKGIVIQHSLSTIKEGYLIWADGDVVFEKNEDYTNFPTCLFNGEALACQVEDDNHIESGILIFDMEHPDIQLFTKAYIKNYSLNEIVNNYGEPYDGHVARRSLGHSGIKYVDLNSTYGRGGIQSDPNETFLHPEIKARFTHNIGITGKRSYNMWNYVKSKDKIFNLLEESAPKMSDPQIKKIISLRSKRKAQIV